MTRVVPYESAWADAVADIERLSFRDPWGRESLMRTIGGQQALTLVALEGESPVGYLCALDLKGEMEILKLAVMPSARERGVGLRLLEALLGRAGELGAGSIHIEVRESNRAARMLYEKCRFRYTGRRLNYYDNPREDAVLMRLMLKK